MNSLLQLKNITKRYPGHHKNSRHVAVADVSFEIPAGSRMGLVGESGSGKTTLGRCAVMLTRADEGAIIFDGTDLGSLSTAELRDRRREFQYVFQNPYRSFNPTMSIREAIAEPLINHSVCSKTDVMDHVLELLKTVELSAELADRYPHEVSGGEMQRASIARALSVSPRLLVLDEPLSALDVSLRAQMLEMFERLRHELNLTYLMISHDLGVVAHHTDTIAVMFSSRIVEFGETKTVLARPIHPYTKGLLAAIPSIDPQRHKTLTTTGASISTKPGDKGCAYFPRCPHPSKNSRCETERPDLRGTTSGVAACHHSEAPGDTANAS